MSLPYASFWDRLLALLIDSLLTALIAILLMPLLGLPLLPEPNDLETRLRLHLVSIFVGWIYYAGFQSSVYQATPGKLIRGIFVTDTEGYRLSFTKATGRYFSKLLSGLTLLLGYLLAAFTPKKQALHDLLAHTLVLKHPSS